MYDLDMAIMATMIAFLANVIMCPIVIPILRKVKFGQQVRNDGPKDHLKKSGTPTMGGIVILISFLIGSAMFMNSLESKLVVFTTVCFGIIGFLDDYIKIVKKRSLGLKAIEKIILQLIVCGILLYFLMTSKTTNYAEIYIPFIGSTLNLGYLFIPFAIFAILGTVNGVNLTDGLDGLACGVTLLISTFFVFISWMLKSPLLGIAGAASGSLLGFLLFNTYPAKVFMGDTGSLALGGFVVSVAIILKMPLFLVIVGLIYVLEALSVIIQVFYFKITHGKRFFKMAPLHHHYEMKGVTETKIVMTFYIITTILCLIGFLGTKNMF